MKSIKMGIGKCTLMSVEKMLKNQNVKSIRLDAFSLNPIALRLYEKNGYKKVGKINLRKGIFYLYEKEVEI